MNAARNSNNGIIKVHLKYLSLLSTDQTEYRESRYAIGGVFADTFNLLTFPYLAIARPLAELTGFVPVFQCLPVNPAHPGASQLAPG